VEKYDKFTSELGLLASVLYGAKLLFCMRVEMDMFNIEFDFDTSFVVMPPAFFPQAVAMIDKFHDEIDAQIRCAITAPWMDHPADHKWQWKSHMPRLGVLQRRPYEEALLRYVPIDEGEFVHPVPLRPDRIRDGNAPVTPEQNEALDDELMEEEAEVGETNLSHAV
jgi:hypothetical protein